MAETKKFLADLKRRLKRTRENLQIYDFQVASKDLADFFAKKNSHLGTIAQDFSDFWLKNFILNDENPKNINSKDEPSAQKLEKLVSLQALLNGERNYDYDFSQDEWREIQSDVNLGADEIPLEILESIMAIILEKCEF